MQALPLLSLQQYVQPMQHSPIRFGARLCRPLFSNHWCVVVCVTVVKGAALFSQQQPLQHSTRCQRRAHAPLMATFLKLVGAAAQAAATCTLPPSMGASSSSCGSWERVDVQWCTPLGRLRCHMCTAAGCTAGLFHSRLRVIWCFAVTTSNTVAVYR